MTQNHVVSSLSFDLYSEETSIKIPMGFLFLFKNNNNKKSSSFQLSLMMRQTNKEFYKFHHKLNENDFGGRREKVPNVKINKT